MEFIGQLDEQQKKVQVDILDRKILFLLSKNARYSESSIASCLKISKEVVHYRIKRMQQEKFLTGFITVLNDQRLGKTVHAINLSLHPSPEHELLINRLVNDSHISNVKHYNSLLDLQFSVTTTSLSEFVQFFDELMNHHHHLIKDYNISTILSEQFMGLDFLLDGIEKPLIQEKKGSSFQKEFQSAKTHLPLKLDDKDLAILSALKLNARLPILSISQSLHLSTTSVQNRIQQLIKTGAIKCFIPYISLSNLGYQWYTLHLRTKNLSQSTFTQYVQQHPNIVWMTKRLGKWNYHLNMWVKNNTEFNKVVQELGHTFKDSIIAYDSSLVHKQYKFNQKVE